MGSRDFLYGIQSRRRGKFGAGGLKAVLNIVFETPMVKLMLSCKTPSPFLGHHWCNEEERPAAWATADLL